MGIAYSQYRSAQRSLDYIHSIKTDMESLLYSKTRLLYSGIALGNAEYSHAVQCVNEVIDDLFSRHSRECTTIIEAWQQQGALRHEE